MTGTLEALIEQERLPADYLHVVRTFWQPLADAIARRAAGQKPLIVGVNGAQGSGKTTLCRFLEELLRQRSLRAVTLSLDDLYLSRAERQELAAAVHPLFATRGVPGTHAATLGMAIIEHVRAGRTFDLPRFDKARDDRSEHSRRVAGPVDVLLFEGWCVGAAPQAGDALLRPVNALEAGEDTDGTWRTLVNHWLAEDYARLFAQIDMLVMLRVADFAAVRRNRALQETRLRQSQPDAPEVMDQASLDRFLMHYQRLTKHMLAEMPARADIVFTLDEDQRPVRVTGGLAKPGDN